MSITLFYLVCRVYLVVEVFRNLAYLDPEVYQTPDVSACSLAELQRQSLRGIIADAIAVGCLFLSCFLMFVRAALWVYIAVILISYRSRRYELESHDQPMPIRQDPPLYHNETSICA